MKKLIFVVGVLILFLIIFFTSHSPSRKFSAEVKRVIDGDTFEIENHIKVRVLGINAPEKGEQYFEEAKDRLQQLIENRTVLLEKDKLNKDRYGRLLRYVFLENDFIDEELLREGYAKFFNPNNVTLKYESILLQAENHAKNERRGVWSIS